MMELKWMNSFTGECFESLFKGIVTAFKDMRHCKACRTIKMFQFERIEEV